MIRLPLAAFVVASAAACSGGEAGGGDGCGSARGELPAGLVELAWDDGDTPNSLRGSGIEITVGETGNEFSLDEEPTWESVRFELTRPARIHGLTVVWSNLDAASGGLEVGLYEDFGYNGVSFWQANPLWTGDRCARDAEPETPLTYVLDEPVEIPDPGLVHVAHLGLHGNDPTFGYDESYLGEGSCAVWEECHSAVNLPDADADLFFQGVTLSFPYDFGVRLHVEWLDEIAPEDRVFQPAGLEGTWLRFAWGDYDGDGWEDLLAGNFPIFPVLWRNLGDGTFADVTLDAFGSLPNEYIGAVGTWGDYDNDGCLDLYLYNVHLDYPNSLLRSNCDGTFTDVTDVSGPVDAAVSTPCGSPAPQTQSAAWIDLDSDSYLDLYVANYNCGFAGYVFEDDVFRNRGDGTFEEWLPGTHGLESARLNGRGTSPVDYDQDGDVDLLVHNYVLDRNLFYRNLGGGTLEEIARENGLAGDPTAFDGFTYHGHTLGAAWGDLDGDGDFDLVETNLAHPRFFHFSDRTRVLLQDAPSGTFFDIAGGNSADPVSFAGIRYAEAHTVPVLGDFDRDGDLDLVISGRYEYTGRPTEFYWGNGDGTFELDSFRAIDTRDGWGLAAADYDHDGDLDLMTRLGLFRNDFPAPGHWLSVRAVGNLQSNRAAIGATIRVFAGGRTFLGYVPGSSGQGCQDTQSVHFGLGDLDEVDGIEVLFPGGRHARYDGPFAADQHLRLFEDGTILPGWN